MFDWGRGSKSARRFESVPKDANEPGGISNIQTGQENGNRQFANARVHYSPPAASAQSDNHRPSCIFAKCVRRASQIRRCLWMTGLRQRSTLEFDTADPKHLTSTLRAQRKHLPSMLIVNAFLTLADVTNR
jgi:hypothetical protein